MKALGKNVWSEEKEMQELNIESDYFMVENSANTLGPMGDESARIGGRPATDKVLERNKGVVMRDGLMEELRRNNMARPINNSNSSNAARDRHNRIVGAE